MQVGNVWLTTSKFKDTQPQANVTPAEVMFLRTKFERLAGEEPVKFLTGVHDVERGAQEEQKRLYSRFGQDRVDELFGKGLPNFPQTFAELTPPVETGDHPDVLKAAKKPPAALPGPTPKKFAAEPNVTKGLAGTPKVEPTVLTPTPTKLTPA